MAFRSKTSETGASVDVPTFPPRPPTRTELKKNLAELKKVVLKHPLDLDARLRIARTYRLLDKPRHAVEHYRSVARYLALAGQPLPAIAVAKELLQIDAQHNETLLFLARLYARTGGARIATPRDDGAGAADVLSAWPTTHTGVWRAIRPDGDPLLRTLSIAEVAAVAEPAPGEAPPALPANNDDGDALPLEESQVLEERRASGEHDVIEVNTGEIESEEDDISADNLEEVSGSHLVDLPEYTGEHVNLPHLPLFSSLAPEAFVELSAALVLKTVAADSVLWKEGDDGLFVAIIAGGEALAYRGEGENAVNLARLRQGDFAGVFALLSERRRQASLKAITDLSYFELHRNVVEHLANQNPQLAIALRTFFRERVVANALAILPVFRDMDPETRTLVAQRFKTKHYQDGDELIYEGAEVNGLWVVLEGAVHVGHEPDEGAMEPIRKLPAGHFLGTVAGLCGAATDASALAVGDVTTVTLSHRALADLSAVHNGLRTVGESLREADLPITERIFGGSAQLPGDLQPTFLQPRDRP